MYRKAIVPIVLLLLQACSKQPPFLPFNRTDFFTCTDDAWLQTSRALARLAPQDSLLQLGNITYVDTKLQTCAFVYYRGTQGNSNLVFTHVLLPNGQKQASITKCEGTQCDCKVTTILTSTGDVKVDCNCKSCTMLVSHLEEEQP